MGNVLGRQFSTNKPNQKWVTDVTEFKINGEIVAYQMASRPLLSMVDEMLSKAMMVLGKDQYPLLHSDQGW